MPIVRLTCSMLALSSLTVIACAEPEPAACDLAVERATAVYLDCIAELGLEELQFALTPQGDITVEFAAGTTPAQETQASEACEPPMEQTFQLTAIACEHVVVGEPASAEQLTAQIDQAASAGFSGSISIFRDHMLVLETAHGLADRAMAVPNDVTTAFDVGSIMKDLTAVAVFRLEGEGMLARGDTLDLWFSVPPDKAAITLAQLLAHRAGLHDYHDTTGDFEPLGRDEALARIFGQELLFAPGQDTAYSNSGYTLLAAIVEEASGQPFWGYMRSILDEADLTSTGTYGDMLWPASRVAVGYEGLVHGERNSPLNWGPPTWALIGNGGLVSNVRDLDSFLAQLGGGALLPDDVDDAYRTDHLSPTALTIGDAALFAMSGANDFGFAAVAGVVPSLGVRVVVTSNASPLVDPTTLAAQLLMSVTGQYIDVP